MKVRVTAILIKDSKLLLLEQNVDNERGWSLPGGGVEEGESLETALKREMKEETGLNVNIKELLYVCDYIKYGNHVVHITFLVHSNDTELGKSTPGLDRNVIKSMKFIPIEDLNNYGFSVKFKELVLNNFPGKGTYMGAKSNIGL